MFGGRSRGESNPAQRATCRSDPCGEKVLVLDRIDEEVLANSAPDCGTVVKHRPPGSLCRSGRGTTRGSPARECRVDSGLLRVVRMFEELLVTRTSDCAVSWSRSRPTLCLRRGFADVPIECCGESHVDPTRHFSRRTRSPVVAALMRCQFRPQRRQSHRQRSASLLVAIPVRYWRTPPPAGGTSPSLRRPEGWLRLDSRADSLEVMGTRLAYPGIRLRGGESAATAATSIPLVGGHLRGIKRQPALS